MKKECGDVINVNGKERGKTTRSQNAAGRSKQDSALGEEHKRVWHQGDCTIN